METGFIDYTHCLKMGEWEQSKAIQLFAQPDDDKLLELIESSRKSGILGYRSTGGGYSDVPRKYFYEPVIIIEWAIAIGLILPVELTDWYNRQGEPKPGDIPSYLDTTHDLHSPELKIAVEAWQAVLECNPERPKVGSRKALIESWLNTNHPELNDSQIDRIAVMVNPDKKH